MDIIEKLRVENVDGITKAIDLIIHYAQQHEEVEQVIQFGSTAKGKVDALSDLDLLVVMNTEKDFHHRNIDMRMQVKAPVDIDIICLRPDELERNRNRPFYRHILNQGKIIYAK